MVKYITLYCMTFFKNFPIVVVLNVMNRNKEYLPKNSIPYNFEKDNFIVFIITIIRGEDVFIKRRFKEG